MSEALYVLEPGSYLRREGNALKVVKDKAQVQHIPAEGLKRLTLVGYISLSGRVLDFLIQKRIETVFMTPTGRFRARLALDEHRHVLLRRAQYLRLSEEAFAMKTAVRIVSGKIDNLSNFLMIRGRQYNEPALKTAALQIRVIQRRLASAKNLDEVRGYEGAATRVYYSVFQKMIRNPEFDFPGRNRRPPKDPINALLSFVYTLLTNEVLSAVKSVGLDPYLGALHEISYGRPSLACDLVEEYRAFLGDRLVLGLINKKLVRRDDFVFRTPVQEAYADEAELAANRPVEMKPAIARTFIAAYEEMMARGILYPLQNKQLSYRFLILQQARQFAAFLENPGTSVYAPFCWQK